MQKPRWILIVVGVAALALSPAVPAADLVYFEEDGGGGNPRGLYDFDSDTGGSTLRTTVPGGPRFFSLTRRPSDGQVFAVHPLGSIIYRLDIDTGNFDAGTGTGLDTIADITFDPRSNTMYGLGRNTSLLYEINPENGSSRQIGMVAPVRAGLTFSPSGVLYGFGVFDGNLYTIDPSDGFVEFVGGSGDPVSLIEDADFTPDGELFITDFNGTLFVVNPADGNRRRVGTTGMGPGLVGILGTVGRVCDPCDMNCDGAVNASDIQPFIERLFNDADPCCGSRGQPGHSGDTNYDGVVNAADIQGFIDCLFG